MYKKNELIIKMLYSLFGGKILGILAENTE